MNKHIDSWGTVTAIGLAAALLGTSAHGQATAHSQKQVPGTLRQATIDMATGVLTREAPDKAALLVIVWANTDYSGYYATPFVSGEEWLDWGSLITTSGSDIVGEYQFGYATTVLDTTVGGSGVDLCTNFYFGATGWCAESGLGLVADESICWSGLPGTVTTGVAAGWVITVDLTGGFEFQMSTGPFGYAMEFFDISTGPLLCYAGTTGGGSYDGNGQEDAFDIYVPDVASGTCGTYSFGGQPLNISSWWLHFATADGNNGVQASCNWYCGSGVNLDGFTVTSPPVLGGSFSSYVVHGRFGALLYAYSSPLSLTISTSCGPEQILVNFLDPGGMLFGNPPVGIGSGTSIDLPLGINLDFCGFTFYVQAVSFGGGFCLHCAYACTIGF